MGLTLIGPQRTGNIHRGIPLAQTKPVYFVVGVPGYENGKRRDCVVRNRATYTSTHNELSDDYAYDVPFYS